jgi:hypothetical protein
MRPLHPNLNSDSANDCFRGLHRGIVHPIPTSEVSRCYRHCLTDRVQALRPHSQPSLKITSVACHRDEEKNFLQRSQNKQCRPFGRKGRAFPASSIAATWRKTIAVEISASLRFPPCTLISTSHWMFVTILSSDIHRVLSLLGCLIASEAKKLPTALTRINGTFSSPESRTSVLFSASSPKGLSH